MGKSAPMETLVSLRQTHNDLRVVAGADVDPSGFTLLAVLRNEMYFLPDFLAHYRRLGVERFVFLNDRSDDGSIEYLCQQPDTVIVESGRTYGDMVEIPSTQANGIETVRILPLWRGMLHDMFALDRWTLQVDLDEFVRLPRGMTFQDLVARLEKRKARAVWGVMLDVYPRDIAAIAEQSQAARLDTAATWYFDGERHLRLRRKRRPRPIYPGARARLYHAYGVDKLYSALGVKAWKMKDRWLRAVWQGPQPYGYNALQKPTLLKWGDNCYFRSSHQTNLIASPNFLLPIQHFRFTGALYRKIHTALRENSYSNNSADHRLLSALLTTMEEQNGSFLYQKSQVLASFDDLARAGNAVGF